MSNNIKNILNGFYIKYNRPEFISPDPLEFLYKYPEDMELAGFIASCFALGRVKSIISAVETVLTKLRPIRSFITSHTYKDFLKIFKDFKYRFFTEEHIASLLSGLSVIVNNYGTLENLFTEKKSDSIIEMQKSFAAEFKKACINDTGILLADPDKGSACKRFNLFLRWMVRKDDVDPGVWKKVKTDRLLIPLDTHMLRIGRGLGFTNSRNAGMNTVIEITDAFKKIVPEDPVKYDFALTRMGIHPDRNLSELFNAVKLRKTA